MTDCFDGSDEGILLCDSTNVTARTTTIRANVTSNMTRGTEITQQPNITYPTDETSTDEVPTDLVPSTSTSETTPFYPTRPEVITFTIVTISFGRPYRPARKVLVCCNCVLCLDHI